MCDSPVFRRITHERERKLIFIMNKETKNIEVENGGFGSNTPPTTTPMPQTEEKAEDVFGALGAFGGFGSNTPPTTTMPVPNADVKADNKSGGFGAGPIEPVRNKDENPKITAKIPLSLCAELDGPKAQLKPGALFSQEEMLNLSVGKKGHFQELAEKFSSKPSRVPTGLVELDSITGGGWVSDGISVVAAMPNIGKTTLLIQSACAMAQGGRVVVYITNDMRKSALEAKVISQISYRLLGENCYRLHDIMGGMIKIDLPQNPAICKKMEDTLQNLHIRDMIYDEDFDSNPKVVSKLSNLTKLQKIISAYLNTYDKVIFIIDSLQQAASSIDTGKNGVDEILRYLKLVSALAPVVVVSTLNRSGYEKEEGNISFKDLKESGSIEYNSDLIVTMVPAGFVDKSEDLKAFKSKDYRNILFSCKKSRDSAEQDVKLTLYAPGCTFIRCEEEENKSNSAPVEKTANTPKVNAPTVNLPPNGVNWKLIT